MQNDPRNIFNKKKQNKNTITGNFLEVASNSVLLLCPANRLATDPLQNNTSLPLCLWKHFNITVPYKSSAQKSKIKFFHTAWIHTHFVSGNMSSIFYQKRTSKVDEQRWRCGTLQNCTDCKLKGLSLLWHVVYRFAKHKSLHREHGLFVVGL